MQLSRFPRIRFAHLPTPLERLDRLSTYLGGPTIWIKRDDCTGLAGGGNKTRKLEFLMADAIAKGADVVISQGATQSNHTRQTAAACAKFGLDCKILLEDRTGFDDEQYQDNGNVLLERLTGAEISRCPGGTNMDEAMEAIANKCREQGRKPYIIPGGGSNPIGALGYVNAALELTQQANDLGLRIDLIVHATGSCGTQAGLVTGLVGASSPVPVLGIGVRATAPVQKANVLALAQRTATLLELRQPPEEADIKVNCEYVGDGYGIPTVLSLEAIKLLAQEEAVLLDPVYSSKGMAGLIDLIRKDQFKPGQNIVFLHTGGAQALSAYASYFS